MTGDEIRMWRLERRWKQTEAAEALGLSVGTWRNAEAKRTAPVREILALAVVGYAAREKSAAEAA